MASGGLPTSTVGGGVVGQLARSVALQVALSIIETVVLSGEPPTATAPKLGTYTVWLVGSANSPSGSSPTGTVAGVCRQPEVFSALQVAPLNTETVLSWTLVT